MYDVFAETSVKNIVIYCHSAKEINDRKQKYSKYKRTN